MKNGILVMAVDDFILTTGFKEVVEQRNWSAYHISCKS